MASYNRSLFNDSAVTTDNATFAHVSITDTLDITGAAMSGATNVWTELQTALDSGTTDITNATTTANNALPKSGGTMTGDIVMGSHLVDGVDISARDAILTSTASTAATNAANIATNTTNITNATTTANNALPKSGGTMTGDIVMGSYLVDGVDISARDAVLTSTASTAATNATNIATNTTNITNATTTADNALPKSGGTMTGDIVMGAFLVDGVDISARDVILTSTASTAATNAANIATNTTAIATKASTMQDAYDNTGTLTHITTSLIGGPVEIQKGLDAISNELILFKNSYGVQTGNINSLGSCTFGKMTIVDGGYNISTNYANTNLTSPTASHLTLRSDGYRLECYNNGTNTALSCVTPDNFKIYSNLIQRMHIQHTGNYVAFQSNTASATMSIGPTNITGYIDLNMNNNDIASVNTITCTALTTDTIYMTGLLTMVTVGNAGIELIGTLGAFIDFSESSNVDYSTRLIRGDGTNGNFVIDQTGTGVTQFKNNGSTRMEISTGITCVGNLIASTNAYSVGTTGNRWKEMYVIGGLLITSDSRLKRDLLPLSLGLDFVNKLNPITFKWNDDIRIGEDGVEYIETHTRGHVGLIAQELHQAILDCNEDLYTTDLVSNEFYVNPDAKDEYAVKYDMFVPVLINAIKELSAEVAALREIINAP